MNPGAAEEVGKVATGFMDSMKSQPLALALAIANIGLLGLMFLIVFYSQQRRELDYQANKELREILTHCNAPPQQ